MRKNHKRAAVLATGALVLGSTGVAYAYWTTTGTGSGTGSTTAGGATLTFTQNPAGAPDTSVALAPMYPGDSAQTLTVRVRNTSTTESAYVTEVRAYITTDKPGCTGDDFQLYPDGAPPVPATAPSDLPGTALTWTAADLAAGAAANATGWVKFRNTGANQDACKGAAVTINYVVPAVP